MELLTVNELEQEITLNYNRLQESRSKDEPVLVELFEARMNRALDSYSNFLQFAMAGAIDEISEIEKEA